MKYCPCVMVSLRYKRFPPPRDKWHLKLVGDVEHSTSLRNGLLANPAGKGHI